MKRYFVGGKEITEKEAEDIRKQNEQYINSESMSDWWKCRFIFVIEDEK